MRKDKEKAIKLRTEGKSYQEIRKELGVPLSTLSGWFSGADWSKEIRKRRSHSAGLARPARMRELNKIRGNRLIATYEKARQEARQELVTRRLDPLFIGGVMMYLAEGDRQSRSYLRLTSIDPAIVAFYLQFLRKACGVPKTKIRAYLTIYPESDEATCRRFWAFGTGISMSQFTKSVITKGRARPTQFHNGSCTIVIGSTYLKEKMNIWVKELPKELMKLPYYENIGPNAAMV